MRRTKFAGRPVFYQDFVSDYGAAATFVWPVSGSEKKSSPNINLKN
jgi:hypothetical protein